MGKVEGTQLDWTTLDKYKETLAPNIIGSQSCLPRSDKQKVAHLSFDLFHYQKQIRNAFKIKTREKM